MKKARKPAAKAAKKAAPRKAAAAASPYRLTATGATFELDVKKEGVEAVFGAAYLLIDKAYVSLAGDHVKKLRVTLRPKDAKRTAPKALAEEFLADLASQKVRWQLAKNNQPIREYIAEQAMLLATGRIPPPAAAPEPAAEQLTDDQRSEIEKLISEVEEEIKQMNEKKTPSTADPKNIKASWEEKQERETKAP